MKFLRTVSTRRLLAMVAGLIVAVAAGTAIAVAASGRGPVPQPRSLAGAVHNALSAPAVEGITARITFTNHLIDSADIQGSNPILTGASGRLWVSSDHRLRLELQSDNGDAQIVVNNGSFFISDPSSNTVYEGKLPSPDAGAKPATDRGTIPSIAQIQSDLRRLMKHVGVSGAIPSDVAGRAAYTVRVSPKHDTGLLGSAELAWDAARGVPLRIAIYATHDSTPVLELKATDISFGRVPASDFAVSPPSGSKVVKISTPATGSETGREARSSKGHARRAHIGGAAAVARALPFTLSAPGTLAGLQRQTVRLMSMGGHRAALVSYGQGLGGVAVLEQAADKVAPQGAAAGSGAGGDRQGLNLPTVSIHGVTGQELDTALGTLVRFTRGGVSYTVVGSVGPKTADGVARGL